MTNSMLNRIWRVARVPLFVLLVLYIGVAIYRIPAVAEKKRTQEVVARIHAQKLQMRDVTGENLPPEPNPAQKDATIAGIDANKNGIRDDVELAIFKEYPSSSKIRAVLLQYALVLQMQMTLPFLNKETVTATVEDRESRAEVCFWTLSSRSDTKKFLADMEKFQSFVDLRQINTDERKRNHHDFYEHLGSFSSSNQGCDIDSTNLPD